MDGKDLSAVGHAASASKSHQKGPKELKSFTVEFSDNGGASVRESWERKIPEGRRASSGFPLNFDTKNKTFESKARAATYITGLLTGGAGGDEPRPAPRMAAPPRPAIGVAAAKPGGGAIAATAPLGGGPSRPMRPPMPPYGE
jgi:hypothetical protein